LRKENTNFKTEQHPHTRVRGETKYEENQNGQKKI
jgi:hypothetical protein